MRIITLNSLVLLLALTISNAFANGTDNYDAVHAKSASAKQCGTTQAINSPAATPIDATPIDEHPVKKRPKQIVPVYRYTYSAMMYQGSLRHNIIRIAHNYGWDTVVWNNQEDYLWSGNARITGNSLAEVFSKILIKYPLQAQFYSGNHVLAIVPRNLP